MSSEQIYMAFLTKDEETFNHITKLEVKLFCGQDGGGGGDTTALVSKVLEVRIKKLICLIQ